MRAGSIALLLAGLVVVANLGGGAGARPAVPLFAAARIDDFAREEAAPGAIREVRDPTGAARRVLRMAVDDGDVHPLTATGDPRAQLQGPSSIRPGAELWWRAEFLLPRSFPGHVPGWVTVLEGPYGPPYDGTPPWHLEVNGSHLQWSRNGTYGWDIPWRTRVPRGRWVKVLVHMRFAHDGFVEMWVDGRRVTFFSSGGPNPNRVRPTERLRMATRDDSNDGGANAVYVLNYRRHGMFPRVTVYQGPTVLGPTRAAVAAGARRLARG